MTRDTVHTAAQYDVRIDRVHVGVVFDEVGHQLDRPPFAAWSGKLRENLFLGTR